MEEYDQPNEPRPDGAGLEPAAGDSAGTRLAGASGEWAARRVRRLRDYLGETQAQFADRLGTRQQTVSEWETGSSRPRRIAQRLLHMVAEERGYYSAEGVEAPPEHAASTAAAVQEHAHPLGAESAGGGAGESVG